MYSAFTNELLGRSVINYIIALMFFCLIPVWVDASPGLSSSRGLLNVSSAETLDAGNIYVGVWSCYAADLS